jgi:Na+-driven multidrug efflux pump
LIAQGAPFLAVVAISILSPAITIPFESSLRAVGYAVFPAVLGMACIPLNALANYLFIFGWGPIPAMDVLGSAIGTLLVRVFHLLALLGICYGRRLPVTFWFSTLHRALQSGPLRHFMGIAIPLLIHDVLWAFGMIVYNFVFARSGTEALAAFSQLGVIESVLICGFVGCSVACSTLLGQSLGRGALQEAWEQALYMLLACLVLSVLGGIGLWFFSETVAGFSSRLQGEALAFYIYGLEILGLTLSLRIINMVGIVGVLRSGADTRATIVIDLVGMWLVGLPLAAVGILWLNLPFTWLYLIPVLQEAIKLLMTLYRIAQRRWLRNLVLTATNP